MKVNILQLEKMIKELHTNEIGVGLETFLIQIDESDVILSEESYEKLKRISKVFVKDEGII